MLIRISLCLLSIYACSSGIDKTSADQTADVAFAGLDQTSECLKTCETACGDWGEWSELSPTTDTACKGKTLTQSQTRTRTCKATCPEVECSPSEKMEKEVDGTKDCLEPQKCQTSCNTGCTPWTSGEWSPAMATICKGEEFTQTRVHTRECSRTCVDAAGCLCPGVPCDETQNDPRTITGSKVTPCQADDSPYCNDWRPVDGANGEWSPARNTKPLNQRFQQTREEVRTCPDACSDSRCKLTRTKTRDARGTKNRASPAIRTMTCNDFYDANKDTSTETRIDMCNRLSSHVGDRPSWIGHYYPRPHNWDRIPPVRYSNKEGGFVKGCCMWKRGRGPRGEEAAPPRRGG